MLNIDLVRRQPEVIRRSLQRRREDASVVDSLIALDGHRRELTADNDQLRARRNELSEQIGRLMREGKAAEAEELKEEVRLVGEKIDHVDRGLKEVESQLRSLMLNIPNIVADDVPDGDGPEGNVVVREEGERREYSFPLKPHWELSESLGVTDFERGAKLSGRMFYVLGDAGARLQRALVLWMLDLHRREHGYQERSVPFLVLRDVMEGSGNLPKFGDNLYHDDEDGLWLIPTAEVPLTNLYRDEILEPDMLPLKLMAHTPCFRREKAAAGSQVRGLKRLHQFEKVEMYHFTQPEQSEAALKELVEHASHVCRGLGLPFRVLQLCSGDISFPSAKSYDIEVWSPASEEWLEVSTCSNCTDFQARRAGIRFRRERGGRTEFLHTLNGSGLGLPRVLIAVLETYQQPDGSVTLPDVLVPYMDGQDVLRPA